MCKNCGFYYCTDGCPGNDEDYVESRNSEEECAFCGRAISRGEEFCEDAEGNSVCVDCVDAMEIDELLRVCEMKGTVDLLRELGMTRHAV